MTSDNRWVLPAGTAATRDYDVAITPGNKDWQHTGLLTLTLQAGASHEINTETWEFMVVPLSGGGVEVTVVEATGEEQSVTLTGRETVFTGPTDIAYVPKLSSLVLRNNGSRAVRVALPIATATKQAQPLPFTHVAVQDVPVELRGAGVASRQVRNFGVPDTVTADSMIACEVITPAGNWSSYPPHKHDEEREGVETSLEEIYYFEIQAEAGREVADAVGYQRVYGTAERPIEVLTEVRTGDVVLVPHGWHGPAMAPPGYDMYYLNVMAGPGATRAWLICDDPAHAWVREQWESQEIDPRLR